MRIPFASEKHANIAKQVIDVDRELQPDLVKRTLAVEGNELVAYGPNFHRSFVAEVVNRDLCHFRTFTTLTVRLARLTSNAFLENVDLVVRTIGEFGEDAERAPPSATTSSS